MSGIPVLPPELDAVARPLLKVIDQFEARNVPYTVSAARPARDTFKLDQSQMFVIRQRQDENGVIHLIAAAKMGKEVPVSHGLQDY